MMTVVVAEDQQLILKDLCRKIEKAGCGAKILAAAPNGRDALSRMKELKPDIFITDIRMPVMSGLEVIAEIKKLGLPVHTVIISGYRDFEYAREAMKLGVDEYLLKPLSVDDIRFVLQSLAEKISLSASDYNQYMVEEILKANTFPPAQVKTGFLFERCYLMLIMTGSYPTFPINYAIPNRPADQSFPLSGLFSPLLNTGEKLYICPGKNYNECICVFCLNQSGRELVEKAAILLLDAQKKAPDTGAPLTICISREIRHIDSIGIESQIMRNHLSCHMIFSAAGILYSDIYSINEQTERSFLKEEDLEHFALLFREARLQPFSDGLRQLLGLMSDGQAAQKEVEINLKRLFHACIPASMNGEKSSFDMDIDEFITNSKSYEELFSYLEFLVRQLMKANADSGFSSGESEDLAGKIQKYMDQHYMDDININEIAGIFSLTPAYFSRLFKKYTNKRPLEYLTNVRMSHACGYLVHSELAVKDIAERCGFTDPFHFSKTFKAAIGLSPTEYRIHNREL